MDPSAFLNILLSTQSPLLPGPVAMRLALHAAWGIVLGSGVMLLANKFAPRYRWGLSTLMLMWTLLPGALSPTHWLGLAFQTPSWPSVLICLAWLVRSARPAEQLKVHEVVALRARNLLTLAAILLGWVLLLDTLAWLPVSLYSWGFSPLAVAGVALFATLFWAVFGVQDDASEVRRAGQRWLPALPLLVLALFVMTRLPSGNLWDALIDPWLWLLLQFGSFFSVVRRYRAVRRLPPATRV